jgi:sugar transferase (PEP-CTERM/EpsH1 system associated)
VSRSDSEHRRLICHIIFRLDFGGLENGLVNLINLLPWNIYEHAIICLTNTTTFQKRIRRPDVRIFELQKEPGKNLTVYGRVWRLVRGLHPDIVHTRNLPSIDMLAPAALAGVRRLIHSEHGLDFMELEGKHRKYNQLRRLSRLIVKRYIVVSRDLTVWLNRNVGIPMDKISLIYNGVDTERFHPAQSTSMVLPRGFAPPGSFIIGSLGRLEPVKDQVTLTRAFLRLLEIRPQLRNILRLVIVGDGKLRPEIEDLLSYNGAANLAWLPGFRDDVAELYREFSLFVLPSRREGISNTILEAMASGLPVVATSVGGNPEIIKDGLTGKLVPPADPNALASALLLYLDNQQLITIHGNGGRKCVLDNFTISEMLRCYRHIYDTI